MVDHLAAAGSPWPENPNCIYMGGFGLGPMNPVTSWDQEYGLWVRASRCATRTATTSFSRSSTARATSGTTPRSATTAGSSSSPRRCRRRSLGLKPEDIVIAATHAHSSPDFIGGWGFVPDWYMEQVSDTIKSTIREAMASMRPAVLEAGEHEARPFNSERRGTYRSAEEQHLAWLRAYDPGDGRRRSPPSAPTPRTPRLSGPTTARPPPTGPGCSRRASRSASAASACTS